MIQKSTHRLTLVVLIVAMIAVIALAFTATHYQHDRDVLLTLIQAYGLGCPQ